MDENKLEKEKFYFCEHLNDWVKYCGTQIHNGIIYHNFFRSGVGLFYWLDPKDVEEREYNL